MNCEKFNDQLPEYLDKTLAAAEQAAAREHVEKCGDCQLALARQEAFAKSIRLSLNRETKGLSLRPQTRRNIVKALKPRGFLPAASESIRAFYEGIWRRPAWAIVVLLGLLLLIPGRHFYRYPAKIPAQQTAVKDGPFTYVINVPIQAETHIYRRQNNMAVDAFVIETSVADLSFSEKARSSPSLQIHVN